MNYGNYGNKYGNKYGIPELWNNEVHTTTDSL